MNGGELAEVTRCTNCNAPLSGPYCSACGQRYQPHIHSLAEFITEAAESITHADSRVWRTLWPLLVRPGFLTREFLDGRRARYLPPFRLYLVLSVVFFLVAVAGEHGKVRFLQVGTSENGQPVASIARLEPSPDNPGETPAQRAHRICDNGTYELVGKAYIEPRLREACHTIVIDNGAGLAQALYHNIPRALIILLPLLALVMRALYWRRHYVEHLLFFVHTHAFAFLVLTLCVLAVRFIPSGWFAGLVTVALVLVIPYYTYRAMLRVYEQGRWFTRLRFSVLALSYLALASLMALTLSVYTMITL